MSAATFQALIAAAGLQYARIVPVQVNNSNSTSFTSALGNPSSDRIIVVAYSEVDVGTTNSTSLTLDGNAMHLIVAGNSTAGGFNANAISLFTLPWPNNTSGTIAGLPGGTKDHSVQVYALYGADGEVPSSVPQVNTSTSGTISIPKGGVAAMVNLTGLINGTSVSYTGFTKDNEVLGSNIGGNAKFTTGQGHVDTIPAGNPSLAWSVSTGQVNILAAWGPPRGTATATYNGNSLSSATSFPSFSIGAADPGRVVVVKFGGGLPGATVTIGGVTATLRLSDGVAHSWYTAVVPTGTTATITTSSAVQLVGCYSLYGVNEAPSYTWNGTTLSFNINCFKGGVLLASGNSNNGSSSSWSVGTKDYDSGSVGVSSMMHDLPTVSAANRTVTWTPNLGGVFRTMACSWAPK